MPEDIKKLEQRLWSAADHLRANSSLWLNESAQSANVSPSIIAGRACNHVDHKGAWRLFSKYCPVINVKISAE
ncbi:MAG: hypothetical protein Q8P86_00175 [bacterium]|nr:hypothetical protein [bacterium]